MSLGGLLFYEGRADLGERRVVVVRLVGREGGKTVVGT